MSTSDGLAAPTADGGNSDFGHRPPTADSGNRDYGNRPPSRSRPYAPRPSARLLPDACAAAEVSA
ncbi:hypothetical protein GCM10010326_41220 [Streptomyces xanthochromogenes]|uniref:Uncharacterized protein n=1 Tax=Streptomyces xanthochromogenes TaxID=67384 RepID=A0ABQ3ACY7_9ACTN|nr:hypothetical protein GCM10010326_41220 [Streptomyces xanthochromogenes]